MAPLIKPDPRVRIYGYPTSPYFEHAAIVPFYTQHHLRHSYDHVIAFFSDFGEGPTVNNTRLFKEIPLSLYLCYPYSSVKHRYEAMLRFGWQQKAKRIFADADWIAKEAEVLFKRPVPVVPVGVDTLRFHPDAGMREEARKKIGYSDRDIVLLNVSSLEQRKGTWRVVEALSRLKNQALNLKFYVLGKGPEEKILRQKVQDLGLKDRVVFGGETSELETYYNMADIFMMLPDAEGNSVACHEAMSCGLPVIVSDTFGFRESVGEQAGLFVDPGVPGAIDAAIMKVAENLQIRKQMGLAARTYVSRYATWGSSAEKLLKVLS